MLLYPLGVDLELEGVQLVARLEPWTPKLHFEDRKALFEEIMESNKTYKQLSPEEKQSVIAMVQRSLYLAADHVDEWIPDAFRESDYDQKIVIELHLLNAQVEAEVYDRKTLTSKRLSEIAESIESDLNELEG